MVKPYTFSKHDPDSYTEDKLFTQDRRHNALTVNTGRISGSHVIEVSDGGDQLDDALRAAGSDILSGQYSYVRDGFVRGALRPAMHGQGRGRDR